MLDIAKINKTYRSAAKSVTAVEDFSLTVNAGEFVALHGPSGCGKSTLLLIAGGMLHPDSGTVQVDGRNLYDMNAEQRARYRAANIGFVFQQFHLIPYLNVLDNVLTSGLAVPVPDDRQRALELLNRFGLGHRLQHVPSEMSTGERQRAALARAMLHQPKLVLADEPTGNLDDENGNIVLGHLRDFAAEGGAVLLVTHDRRAADYAQKMIPMQTPGEEKSVRRGKGVRYN